MICTQESKAIKLGEKIRKNPNRKKIEDPTGRGKTRLRLYFTSSINQRRRHKESPINNQCPGKIGYSAV